MRKSTTERKIQLDYRDFKNKNRKFGSEKLSE